MLFSERMQFEREFFEWAAKRNVAGTPANVLAFILGRDDWREKIAEHTLHGEAENLLGCKIRVQDPVLCERCHREVPMLLDGRCFDCRQVT